MPPLTRRIRLFIHERTFFLYDSFVPSVFDAIQRSQLFAILSEASLFSPLASAAQRRGERGLGGEGVRGKKSAISSMFLCTSPKDLAMLNTLLYEISVFRDRMVGRIAYALDLSTGIFIGLFGHTTCGCHIRLGKKTGAVGWGLWDDQKYRNHRNHRNHRRCGGRWFFL